MRENYGSGVLASEKRNRASSEIEARDQFNRDHPPVTGLVVPDDLRTMDLPARPWRNNRGRYFELGEYEILGAHLAELLPGGASVRHRHTTEAYLYIVKGRGFSLINYDDDPVRIVEWSEGTLLAPPRWAWHQHFNTDDANSARYLAVQDTGLLRTLRLHNIERHAQQLTVDEGRSLLLQATKDVEVSGAAEPSAPSIDG